MLKVYWWQPPNGGHNLGDELTPFLLQHVFGVEHCRVPRAEADLLSTGSILQWMWDKPELRNRERPVSIVGAGLMHPWLPYDTPIPARIYSVRGYLTRQLLGDWVGDRVLLGDPGLLAAAGQRVSYKRAHRYGVVAHLSQTGSSRFAQALAGLKDYTVISFNSDQVPSVLEKMASCDIILSQGLHGLILADALGIPNAWINIGPIHRASAFKFYDYFSSVGRPFDAVLDSALFTEREINRSLVEVSSRRIRDMQIQVVDAFGTFFESQQLTYRLPAV